MWVRGDLVRPAPGDKRRAIAAKLRNPARRPLASFLLLVDRNHSDKRHEAAWIASWAVREYLTAQ